MIIQVEGATTADVAAAKRSLEALTGTWGHQMAEPPAQAAAGTVHGDGKVIDPVSVASLVLSIPPAALAVSDLADRIRKRRRAQDLIDRARHLAAQQVTVLVISQSRAVELRSLSPDQLLDAADDDAS